MRFALVMVGLVFLSPARAATVEVLVRERGAGPIANQYVVLQPTAAPGEVPFWDARRMQAVVTGADGKAVFPSVPIGRFTVNLERITAPGLINPSANPLAPPPQLTIAAEGDKVPVEIEVWRGSLLSAEVLVDRSGIPWGAKVVLRSLDGQPTIELPLGPQGRVERLLLPGRYETELSTPPGYLLVDVVWNGESLPGHVARFDVREDPRRQNVSWYLSTPCLITGKLADASGECPVRVVATLEQPGPWIAAAQQRGGSAFQVVPHQDWVPNSKCLYRLWLPDGRWTVSPQGEDLLTSEPESADVTIAPGETRTLDFQLTTKERDLEKGQPLFVQVRTPEGGSLAGAIVEVWPPEAEPLSTDHPLATGKTEPYRSLLIRGLAAGNYLVAAGHDDFLEGTAKVEDYDPEAKEPTRVTVTLREGAKLHARALDDRDRPVRGVELSYTRLSPLPKTTLVNEGIAAKKRYGTGISDITGHIEVAGLYSGEYRVEARMTGEQSTTRFVVVRQGTGKHTRSIETRLTEGERSDVDLLVLPAASLSGRLACSDGGTMPSKVSFRIFPASSRVENLWREKDLTTDAVSAPDNVLLRGDGVDRFQVGPLSPSEYHVAARPHGQDYWSWASNELVPDRATVLPVAEAATLDAGVVEIECGPLVAVVPKIGSKEAVPDLKLGVVRATLRSAREEKRRSVGADVEMHADRAFLRRLQEGKFKTAVTVEHPYLIPPSLAAPEQELELTRGKMLEVHLTFERLGGLVEVRGDGRVARLTPETGSPVIRPVADGLAGFPGTIPGTYRVELCSDPDCVGVSAAWTPVVVLAGRTTFVP